MFLVTAALLIYAADASADIYKHVDEKGDVHFTNVPTTTKFNWVMKEEGSLTVKTVYYGTYDEIIKASSKKYGVDPALAKAIVKAESDFNAKAVSKKDARGLMQLLPETARLLGVKDIHDPEENIEGGIKHLSELMKSFPDDIRLAVAAYNAGSKAVLKYGAVPPYPETRTYVKRVMHYYGIYKKTLN